MDGMDPYSQDPQQNPFVALSMMGFGGGQRGYAQPGGGPISRILNYIHGRQAAEQNATMLQQVNQDIKSSMDGGASWQQAAVQAFHKNPTFMLEHPEVWQSMGHMRAALQPREVSPNASLVDENNQTTYTAPGGATQSSIQFHEGQGDAPDYFTETEPNGAQRVVQSNGKFTVHQTTDGRVLRVNQKNGEVQDMGSMGGDAYSRELDIASKEMHDQLVAGGMPEPQAQAQVGQYRMKMRTDRLQKLSTQQTNPFAMMFGGGATPTAPGAPAAAPGGGAPKITAYDPTGKQVFSNDGVHFTYPDGTPYQAPATQPTQ